MHLVSQALEVAGGSRSGNCASCTVLGKHLKVLAVKGPRKERTILYFSCSCLVKVTLTCLSHVQSFLKSGDLPDPLPPMDSNAFRGRSPPDPLPPMDSNAFRGRSPPDPLHPMDSDAFRGRSLPGPLSPMDSDAFRGRSCWRRARSRKSENRGN